MNILDYLAIRVNNKETVDREVYADGVFDIISYLCLELWDFMKQENRFFGIIPIYKKTVDKSIENFNNSIEDWNNIEIYGKVLYLFKPLLIKSYKRLCSKHLSKADCIIVILYKITDLLKNSSYFTHRAELKNIHRIVKKLYDNIRNNAKTTDLLSLVSSINYYLEKGWVGKTAIYEFNIGEENRATTKTPLEGSGIRLDNGNSCVSEIVWKDE